MSKMLIERISNKVDKNIPYKIYLDNYYVGKIKDGERKYFDLYNGKHTLILKTGIFTSRNIKFITNKEDCYFEVYAGESHLKNLSKLIFEHNDYIEVKRKERIENL